MGRMGDGLIGEGLIGLGGLLNEGNEPRSLAGGAASWMLSALLSRKWTLYRFVLGAEGREEERSLSTSRNRELSSS